MSTDSHLDSIQQRSPHPLPTIMTPLQVKGVSLTQLMVQLLVDPTPGAILSRDATAQQTGEE